MALLVGAKHGVSQIINSKLNIVSSLAEFPSISRVELSEESERVSTVKIYLQDLKVSGHERRGATCPCSPSQGRAQSRLGGEKPKKLLERSDSCC